MNKQTEKSFEELKKLQSGAKFELGQLCNQLREIDNNLPNAWGKKKHALLNKRETIARRLDLLPGIVAENAYRKTIAHLMELAAQLKQVEEELKEQQSTCSNLLEEAKKIDEEILKEVESQVSRSLPPRVRKKEVMEKYIARSNPAYKRFWNENNLDEINKTIDDLTTCRKNLISKAKVYGEDVDLSNPKKWPAAANRYALNAQRGAENHRRLCLAGAFDKK